jgi:hypothetical protein
MIIDRNSGGIDALLSLASAAAMCSAKPKYSVSDNRSTQRATPTISPTLNWAWGRIDHSASYAGAPAARVLDTDLATIDAVATIRRDRGDTTSPPLTGSRGKYKCGHCGQSKAGHKCLAADTVKLPKRRSAGREIGTQCDLSITNALAFPQPPAKRVCISPTAEVIVTPHSAQ